MPHVGEEARPSGTERFGDNTRAAKRLEDRARGFEGLPLLCPCGCDPAATNFRILNLRTLLRRKRHSECTMGKYAEKTIAHAPFQYLLFAVRGKRRQHEIQLPWRKVERNISGLAVPEFAKQGEKSLIGRLLQFLLVGIFRERTGFEPHLPRVVHLQPR